ncbi:MAG: Ig-like domain-containing protein [Burkholderiaceae bacterium]
MSMTKMAGAGSMTTMLKRMLVTLLGAALVACGGGGGNAGTPLLGSGNVAVPGGGGTTTAAPSVSLVLSSTTVTSATPANVTATVKDATGAGVAGQVVKFSTSSGLGTFSAPSALTDASGTAAVVLSTSSSSGSGADTVVAETTVNGTAVKASQGFQLTATNVTIASFSSDIGGGTLSAYGQANLTVSLAGASIGTPVSINVASACVSTGKATLTPASATTTTGTATFTYRDQGCGATTLADSLQASVVGTTLSQALSITLSRPDVSSITFASATPSVIYLKGSGLNETSQVIFTVRDTAGNGLPNQSVELVASTLTGGLTIDGASPINDATKLVKLSDSLGNVSVRVNSGTIPTPVRVKATLAGSSISTVSSSLSIAVGLPSQLNFSLSQATQNIEGCNRDGTTNTYTIIASDRLGNPVPDGTAINFVTEAGQIQSSTTTQVAGGLARTSANFITSEPRPVDCRVTVLAYALGEESFLDQNGNNVYTAGEPFQDLGDIYLDRLFDGVYDAVTDQFLPLSIANATICNTSFASFTNDPAGLLYRNPYTMPIYSNATCDGAWGRAYVRRATETVWSTSEARPLWNALPGNLYNSSACPAKTTLTTGYNLGVRSSGDFYRVGQGGLYDLGAVGAISFIASDANGVRLNPMAAGTTISVIATDGLTASVAGGTPIPSTTTATFATVNYKFDAVTSGVLTLNFTSPSGLVTSISQAVFSGAAPGTLTACTP